MIYLFKQKLTDIERHLFNKIIEFMKHPTDWDTYGKDLEYTKKYGSYKIKNVNENNIRIEYDEQPGENWPNRNSFNIKIKKYSKEYFILKKMINYCREVFANIEEYKKQEIYIKNLPEEEKEKFVRSKKLNRILD